MRAKLFGQGLLLALSTFVLAGTVRAATPVAYSKVKALPAYERAGTFKVEYVATASEGSVAKVDLFASKNHGAFGLVGTVNDGTTPFTFTTDGRGDGYYAFYTVATLSSGESESSKLPTSEADTNVDTMTPSTLDVTKLSINQQPSLVSGEVTGASGAAEAGARVEMYADEAMTALLRSTVATDTGSFGPMTVGGSSVRAVWLAARDAAGNRGAGVKLDNNNSYGGALTDFVLKAEGDTTLVATFVAPASARQFRVQYRHAGGAVWSVDRFDIGTNGTTIRITGLEAGRAYDVRVAPVDSRLNVGFWSTAAARTTGAKVDKVTLPSEVVVVATTPAASPTTTAAAATTKPSTGAVVEPVPTKTETKTETPAANVSAPENTANTAPVEANNTTVEANNAPAADTSGSATPWVILAILIVLAGIATGGYFYWFSGPEEVTTAVTPNESKKADKEKTDEAGSEDEDEDKRW